MAIWSSREARTNLSKLVNAALKNGPQIVTRRGVETVVFVSVEDWERLQSAQKVGRTSSRKKGK